MWAGAGVLLCIVLLTSPIGFPTGPHHHAAVALIGSGAADWLLTKAAAGQSSPVLRVLVGGDLAVSGGGGVPLGRACRLCMNSR